MTTVIEEVPEYDPEVFERVITEVAPTLKGLLRGIVTSDSSALGRQGNLLIPEATSGVLPLVIDSKSTDLEEATQRGVEAYRGENGCDPTIVVVPGTVTMAVGADLSAARKTLRQYLEAVKTSSETGSVGEVRLTGVEEATEQTGGRLRNKVVVITGAAQGFGLGIAKELITEGATLVLADLNLEQATKEAEQLCAQYGDGRAVALRVDVSNDDSTKQFRRQICETVGGLDVFISNAGILRAGSVMDQPVADFDLVTAVNYRGYFLCVQAVAPIMARQYRADKTGWLDIIEINSKSGLEGSKRNFAYAGSKFGGIGLTQSFALELVEDGIKVNAVCPGNYLDGPLWTDPERGLFVQYLRAGKVPGAATVEEVRKHYEAKVPMGRGCTPEDLATAIYYLIDQNYETGQAVPVTGGQNMLS